jgi:hypothetical protein
VAGALLGTTIFGVDTFVPLFVQGARGGTAAAAGAVVTPLVLFWALSAALAAKAVVAFGFRKTARLGALLAAGLSRRLGTAAETASRLLAGHQDVAAVAAPALRQALEQSLLPVFVVLLALAVVQVAVSGWFPGKADLGPQEQAAPAPVEDPVQA